LYSNLWGGISTGSGEDILDRVIRWYTDEFFSEGRMRSRTFSILQGHWFFPEKTFGLLFGDPSTWGVNRISSDIGYVRMWHGIGALGIMIYYTLILVVFVHMILLANKYPEKIMIGILGLYLFIIESKEPFMFNVSVNAFIILIFLYLVINEKKKSTKMVVL